MLRDRWCWWPKWRKPSTTTNSCHQHISSPKFVTNIDVADWNRFDWNWFIWHSKYYWSFPFSINSESIFIRWPIRWLPMSFFRRWVQAWFYTDLRTFFYSTGSASGWTVKTNKSFEAKKWLWQNGEEVDNNIWNRPLKSRVPTIIFRCLLIVLSLIPTN